MQSLVNIGAFIIDMDGVLWHGTQPLPGLTDFFQTLRDGQIPFILATNNASLTPQQYIDKLAKMHVHVNSKEILTSAMATAMHLAKSTDPASTEVFVIGESGAHEALLEQGFTLTDCYDFSNPETLPPLAKKTADIVVCGLDRKLSWNKLATATMHIRAGAKFIATNADTTLPTEFGLAPGNGATLAALQTATGIKPVSIGKPKPIMYQQAISLLGVDRSATIAIGDRLDTDILGAVHADMRSIMVLTGVSTTQDLEKSAFQPTWVMPDIRAISKALNAL